MRDARFWSLGAGAVAAATLSVLLAWPGGSPGPQQGSAAPPSHDAMHAACAAGDVQAMKAAMDALSADDWADMEKHMGDGHHGTMGSHGAGGMMGSGMMGGSMMGSGMMGGGMMGSGMTGR